MEGGEHQVAFRCRELQPSEWKKGAGEQEVLAAPFRQTHIGVVTGPFLGQCHPQQTMPRYIHQVYAMADKLDFKEKKAGLL
jgi:hypothetical protein